MPQWKTPGKCFEIGQSCEERGAAHRFGSTGGSGFCCFFDNDLFALRLFDVMGLFDVLGNSKIPRKKHSYLDVCCLFFFLCFIRLSSLQQLLVLGSISVSWEKGETTSVAWCNYVSKDLKFSLRWTCSTRMFCRSLQHVTPLLIFDTFPWQISLEQSYGCVFCAGSCALLARGSLASTAIGLSGFDLNSWLGRLSFRSLYLT